MPHLEPQELKRIYEAQLAAASRTGDAHHGGHTFSAMLRASRQLPARQLEDERAWVWSDLHIGHRNILGYAKRPFADVEAMDASLYANWEATVGADETLIFVGDVAMGEALAPRTWQRIRSGPGRTKQLVFGNHDLSGSGRLRVAGFDDICSVLCADGDPPLAFTHLPLAEVPAGCINVHGHTHDEPPGRSPHINVSVEQIDYRPLALPRIRALARELIAGRYPPGATTLQRIKALGNEGAPAKPLA